MQALSKIIENMNLFYPLFVVIRKLFFLLFYSTLVVFFVYILGNQQEFLDSSQFFLLSILELLSPINFLLGIILIIMGILQSSTKNTKKTGAIKNLISTLIITLFSFSLFVVIKFLEVWFKH